MQLKDIKILKGPNYWSGYWHNLLEVVIDIEELEDKPTNEIPGFYEKLKAALPSLHSHYCSEGHEGGFFERVVRGTWIGHVIEHVALELQCLAGMDVGYGRTRASGKSGTYYIAIEYKVPQAGCAAVEAAYALIDALLKDEQFHVPSAVEAIRKLYSRHAPGITTAAILAEAKRRNIPYKRLNNGSLYMLGYGANQRRIEASIACTTSGISIDIASDKEQTKAMLHRAYIDVPEGDVVASVEELMEAVSYLGFPLVVKPLDANQGKAVTTNIQNDHDAIQAFTQAQAYSPHVIVERFIQGNDFRFLVVNNKFVAAALRTPATVTGNGRSTIAELIDEANQDPRRGNGHANVLTQIIADQSMKDFLAGRNLSLDSVIPKDERVYLRSTANLSTGGTATDVTDRVHPSNIRLAERISRIMNLDICGIDLIAKDITRPLEDGNGAIIEVNACPGLRMHLEPTNGVKRNVAEPIISMLFPEGKSARIPIVAITGTNGKTTTTRLVAHLARAAGKQVGYTTTEAIYIDNQPICYGDCTGEASAEAVLSDPWVNFAVLECARGGILRSGLGFDKCTTSIVTNVAEDHLGLDGINSIRDMRRVKAVVPESTDRDGYAILNAEDDEVYYMGDYVDCNTALFSLDPENERVKDHCSRGRIAAVIENGFITVMEGEWKNRLCKLVDVPLSFGGNAPCMTRNILAAVLAAYTNKFSHESIIGGLKTFVPSPELTPGRFNIFDFGDFQVMVDYAHNQAAFRELKSYLETIEATRKVGIITGVGDRRDSDIRELGALAAQMFDEIIIRHDTDLRGRTAEEMTNLLSQGIKFTRPDARIHIIPEENAAVAFAIENAWQGSFITTFTESVYEAIAFVQHKRDEYYSHKVVAQV